MSAKNNIKDNITSTQSKPYKTKAVIATPRDVALERFVGSGGVASFSQIYQLFASLSANQGEVGETTCRKRIYELERAGWLKSHYVDARRAGGELVFSLTALAAKEHFSSFERRRFMVGLPAYNELKQQLYAQDARLLLEQELNKQGAKLVNWLNEHELRSLQRRELLAKGLSLSQAGLNFKTNSSPKSRAFEDIADARAIIQQNDAVEQTVEVDIEIDGAYFGQMLRAKIAVFAHASRPTIWVTTSGRATRITKLIDEADASQLIKLLVIE